MPHAPKIAVVVNPRSANGRTGKRWPEFESRLHAAIGDFTTLTTTRPGHAGELARMAIEEGHDTIVSVGGDGTHCEVVNGFFDGARPVNPAAAMAVVPQGTGSDLARGLGMRRFEDALDTLVARNVR
ncbi:MAG: diacylglycerol kinase family lipid kinase, partial [Candidatus Hydrogenedentes bacterium]|nr:diacylglycerol kinase family lipid kinase [Candidatus Hydrogenedentota bacterium]